MKNFLMVLAIATILTNCAVVTKYTPPDRVGAFENSTMLNVDIDTIWISAVSALGKNFFVINNIDKESGLINVSYSGRPEKYIDCGLISLEFGPRKNQYYGNESSSIVQYGEGILRRKMTVEGRANIIFEPTGDKTRVTVNTRYVATKTSQFEAYGRLQPWYTDTVSFNTGEIGRFGASETECLATGRFEAEILDVIKTAAIRKHASKSVMVIEGRP